MMFNITNLTGNTIIIFCALAILGILALVLNKNVEEANQNTKLVLNPLEKFLVKRIYFLVGGNVTVGVKNSMNFADIEGVRVEIVSYMKLKSTHEAIRSLASEEEEDKLYEVLPFYFCIAEMTKLVSTQSIQDAYYSDRTKFENRLRKMLDKEIFYSGYKVTSLKFNVIEPDLRGLETRIAAIAR